MKLKCSSAIFNIQIIIENNHWGCTTGADRSSQVDIHYYVIDWPEADFIIHGHGQAPCWPAVTSIIYFHVFSADTCLSDSQWRPLERGRCFACVTSRQAGPQRGWLSAHRAAPCTALGPTASEQKCLPKSSARRTRCRIFSLIQDVTRECDEMAMYWVLLFRLARCSVAETVDRFQSCRLAGRV